MMLKNRRLEYGVIRRLVLLHVRACVRGWCHYRYILYPCIWSSTILDNFAYCRVLCCNLDVAKRSVVWPSSLSCSPFIDCLAGLQAVSEPGGLAVRVWSVSPRRYGPVLSEYTTLCSLYCWEAV